MGWSSTKTVNTASRVSRGILTSILPSGTPATTSQMAKDVVTFLHWAAEPEHDERKKIGLKAVILFSALTAISLYVKRAKWAGIKTRKICTRKSNDGFTSSLTFPSQYTPLRSTSTINSLVLSVHYIVANINHYSIASGLFVIPEYVTPPPPNQRANDASRVIARRKPQWA